MFVVAKRSRLMSPSRVSCMSTCSLRYLNSNVATRAICSKKTSVHSLMNRTFSSSGQVNCGEATATIKKKKTPNMACLTNTQPNQKLYMQTSAVS